MNGTTHAGEPPYTTSDSGNTQGGAVYDVGFACIVLLFIIILCYTSYKCKRSRETRSLTPTIVSIRTIANSDSDSDDDHCMRLSGGLDDNILSTFPTFLYSEAAKKIRDHGAVNDGSGCSICLGDYRPADVVRLLPECGHLFHVSCIDTWLKVHSTCPICRKSLTTLTELTN